MYTDENLGIMPKNKISSHIKRTITETISRLCIILSSSHLETNNGCKVVGFKTRLLHFLGLFSFGCVVFYIILLTCRVFKQY